MASIFRQKNEIISEENLELKPMSVSSGSSSSKTKTLQDILKLPTNNKEQIIAESILYLSHLDSSFTTTKYLEQAEKVLDYLVKVIPEDHELYHEIWTEFLNIAYKKISLAQKEEDKQIFKESHAKFISKLLKGRKHAKSGNSSSTDSFDWRIVKKIKQVGDKILLHSDEQDSSKDSDFLFLEFKNKIEEAKERIFWQFEQTKATKFANKILQGLYEFISTPENKEKVTKAILEGRFDKKMFQDKKYGIEHTMILGENGGLFVLFNSITNEHLEILAEAVGDQYLKDKIKKIEKNGLNKIIIGKGAFGTVKFAISLFSTETSISGKVICLKKTHSIKRLNEKNKDNMIFSALDQITDLTIGDYYASSNEISKLIFSPMVLDMALIILKKYNTPAEHRKGYLMMELIPQNTGTSIFLKNENGLQLDWVTDIKPYLLEVFTKIQSLLDKNIAMTDLKPDNTLYDIDNRKAYIIDLGGSLKVEEGVKQFNIDEHIIQFTREYSAPEILNKDSQIFDVSLSLAYTCGLMIKQINELIPTNLYGPNPDVIKSNIPDLTKILEELSKDMTKQNPNERKSIPEAILILKLIGDEKLKNQKLYQRYVEKVKHKLENDRPSIDINEDIFEVMSVMLPARIAKNDPDIYSDQQTALLSETIEKFATLSTKTKNKAIWLILGNAGCGKSVNLQIEFIKAIRAWNPEKPLPIYFNLSSSIDLNQIIKKIDLQLNTTLYDLLISDKTSLQDLLLYVDSFDEGIYKDNEEKKSLIKRFFEILSPNSTRKIKIIMSCRTDFLKIDSKHYQKYPDWFKSQDTVFVCDFITPLNYSKTSVKTWLQHFYPNKAPKFGMHLTDLAEKPKDCYNFIQTLELEQYVTTGFILNMIVKIYERNSELQLESSRQSGNLIRIYKEFVSLKLNESIDDSKMTEKLQRISSKWLPSTHLSNGDDSKKHLNEFLFQIGIYLSKTLYYKGNYNLKNLVDSTQAQASIEEFFSLLNYSENSNIGFKNQEIFYILKNLPLKFDFKKRENFSESKNDEIAEEVTISFIHDSIKNYFLYEGFKEEIINKKDSNEVIQFLGWKDLKKDAELIRFLAQAMRENADTYDLIVKCLRKQIEMTKTIKNNESLNIASSNSMTLLVAANCSFTKTDLSSTIIKGADCSNAMLNFVDFTNADLSFCSFRNANLSFSNFSNANLKGINFFKRPDLIGHTKGVICAKFSHDGKFIASGSEDSTCKIWDFKTGKNITTLLGHSKAVKSLSFSFDGLYLATCSPDKCILWDILTWTQKNRIGENIEGDIANVAFSPNNLHLAISTSGKVYVLKISTEECIKTFDKYGFHGSLSFSPDGKRLGMSGFSMANVISKNVWDLFEADHSNQPKNQPNNQPNNQNKSLPFQAPKKSMNTQSTTSKNSIRKKSKYTHYPIAFSPDSMFFIIANVSYECEIYETATKNLVRKLTGHAHQVVSCEFSPDGTYIATASADQTCKIWDFKTGQELKSYSGHRSVVTSISFSPDGNYLLTSSLDRLCKVWDFVVESDLLVSKETNPIRMLEYSPDNKHLAVGQSKSRTLSERIHLDTCKILDSSTGLELFSFESYSFAYSPDGLYLAIAYSKKCFVRDAKSFEIIYSIEDSDDIITQVTFSGDSSCLAVLNDRGVLKFYKAKTGTFDRELEGRNLFVAFSADGRFMGVVFDLDKFKVLDWISFEIIFYIPHIRHVVFSPNGKFLVAFKEINQKGMPTIKANPNDLTHVCYVWDTTLKAQIYKINDDEKKEKKCAAFSPDSKYLVFGSGTSCKILNSSTGFVIQSLEGFHSDVRQVAFSYDGKQLATSTSTTSLKIWHIFQGKEPPSFGHTNHLTCVAYSPDGVHVATSSVDNTSKIWNVNTGKVKHTIRGHSEEVTSLCYDSIGTTLATCSKDKTLKLWRVKDEKCIANRVFEKELQCIMFFPERPNIGVLAKFDKAYTNDKTYKFDHDDHIYIYNKEIFDLFRGQEISNFSFSPDGKSVAFCSSNFECLILSMPNEHEPIALTGHSDDLTCVQYSPNGKFLATASMDNTCKIWDTSSYQEVQALAGHSDGLTWLAFSPDGKYIATCSLDETCKIWELSTGNEFKSLVGHSSVVSCAAFSPDGKQLATSSWDITCKIWDVFSGLEIKSLPSLDNIIEETKNHYFATLYSDFLLSPNTFDVKSAYFDSCEIGKSNYEIIKNDACIVLDKQKIVDEISVGDELSLKTYSARLSEAQIKGFIDDETRKLMKFLNPDLRQKVIIKMTEKVQVDIKQIQKQVETKERSKIPIESKKHLTDEIPEKMNNETIRTTEKSTCCSIF